MSKRPLAILAGFLVAFVIGFGINFALAAAKAKLAKLPMVAAD